MRRPELETSDPGTITRAGSIHEVDRETWNALVGPDDFYQSHEWLSSVQRDRTAQSRYLLSHLGGRLVGALPLYQVGFEGNPPYRPERLRSLLGIEGDHLLAGARRCYRSSVLLAPWLTSGEADRTMAGLLRTATGVAAELGLDGVVLPYLPTSVVERIGRLVPVTVAYASAEAVIPQVGAGVDAYLDSLSGKRRYTVRKEMARYAEAGWSSGIERLADCTSDAARLVSLVEQRHGRPNPAILLERLFRRQVADVDHRAVVFTCRDPQGRLAACAVDYVWQGTLYNRSIGLDDALLRNSFEYFNVLIYQAVAYASQQRLRSLHLSIEPSRAKVQRGAVLSPLWMAAIGTAAPGKRPGIKLVDPGAMIRWAEPYREFTHALPDARWIMPEAVNDSRG